MFFIDVALGEVKDEESSWAFEYSISRLDQTHETKLNNATGQIKSNVSLRLHPKEMMSKIKIKSHIFEM